MMVVLYSRRIAFFWLFRWWLLLVGDCFLQTFFSPFFLQMMHKEPQRLFVTGIIIGRRRRIILYVVRKMAVHCHVTWHIRCCTGQLLEELLVGKRLPSTTSSFLLKNGRWRLDKALDQKPSDRQVNWDDYNSNLLHCIQILQVVSCASRRAELFVDLNGLYILYVWQEKSKEKRHGDDELSSAVSRTLPWVKYTKSRGGHRIARGRHTQWKKPHESTSILWGSIPLGTYALCIHQIEFHSTTKTKTASIIIFRFAATWLRASSA